MIKRLCLFLFGELEWWNREWIILIRKLLFPGLSLFCCLNLFIFWARFCCLKNRDKESVRVSAIRSNGIGQKIVFSTFSVSLVEPHFSGESKFLFVVFLQFSGEKHLLGNFDSSGSLCHFRFQIGCLWYRLFVVTCLGGCIGGLLLDYEALVIRLVLDYGV